MKKKHKILLFIAVFIFIVAFLGHSMPYIGIRNSDVKKVTVSLRPGGKTICLTDAEKKEFMNKLRFLVLLKRADSSSYGQLNGGAVVFRITQADGNRIELWVMSPYMLVNKAGYRSLQSCGDCFSEFAVNIHKERAE